MMGINRVGNFNSNQISRFLNLESLIHLPESSFPNPTYQSIPFCELTSQELFLLDFNNLVVGDTDLIFAFKRHSFLFNCLIFANTIIILN